MLTRLPLHHSRSPSRRVSPAEIFLGLPPFEELENSLPITPSFLLRSWTVNSQRYAFRLKLPKLLLAYFLNSSVQIASQGHSLSLLFGVMAISSIGFCKSTDGSLGNRLDCVVFFRPKFISSAPLSILFPHFVSSCPFYHFSFRPSLSSSLFLFPFSYTRSHVLVYSRIILLCSMLLLYSFYFFSRLYCGMCA